MMRTGGRNGGGAVLLLLVSAFIALGEGKEREFDIRGWGAYEFGQVVKGTSIRGDLNHVWLQRAFMQATIDGKVRDRGHCLLSFESMYSFSVPLIDNNDATKEPVNMFYFHEVQGTYDWGDLSKPYLSLAFGYFPYKYNPDVRNLGEYLFRSGSYPPYLLTYFDFPMTRQLGTHITGRWTPLQGIELEGQVLFTSESQRYPTQDFTLTALPKVTVGDGLLELQGGVSLAHLFSVDKERTQPTRDGRNLYLTNVKTDSLGFVISADSNYYTFAGTKLMARFSLDPLKSMKAGQDAKALFWKEDLKLYSEGAILGLKDYPKSADGVVDYEKLSQRMPVMIGINLPTYPLVSNILIPAVLGWGLEPSSKQKITKGAAFGAAGLLWGAGSWYCDRFLGLNSRFDLISFEWEYYGWKYPDDYTLVFDDMLPIPQTQTPGVDYTIDDRKWSLYFKKDFLHVFSFRAQLARDHMRPICNDRKPSYKSATLTYPEHWYWMAKIFYGF